MVVLLWMTLVCHPFRYEGKVRKNGGCHNTIFYTLSRMVDQGPKSFNKYKKILFCDKTRDANQINAIYWNQCRVGDKKMLSPILEELNHIYREVKLRAFRLIMITFEGQMKDFSPLWVFTQNHISSGSETEGFPINNDNICNTCGRFLTSLGVHAKPYLVEMCIHSRRSRLLLRKYVVQ